MSYLNMGALMVVPKQNMYTFNTEMITHDEKFSNYSLCTWYIINNFKIIFR
jgi:hypothetical protein